MALAILTASAAPGIAIAAAVVAIVSRLAVALAAARASGLPVRLGAALRASILADALLARAFVGALRTRRVAWRGTALILDRGGLLRETR